MAKPLRRPQRVVARRAGDSIPARQPERPTRRIRAQAWGEGLPDIPHMELELIEMRDVLMGRADCPIDNGILTLMEYADGCFARASEMTQLIKAAERKGQVTKGSRLYHFRTGELRDFMEMAKAASDLGSRRVTKEQLVFDMETSGRESRGFNGGR